ncbi:MAG: addiction module protein [Deltaproteobacteria bacterium]|nr:addiction module protein [Deltaproteobacteria bacterium]
METVDLREIKRLSVSERILYVEEIWDSIVNDQHLLETTQAQREELDRRISAYEKNPEEVTSWEEVKSKIKSRK